MELPYYPLHDFGLLMKGMVIGGLGITHVFLAQFAIGGGMLMCYFQWLAHTDRVPLSRRFLDSYFKALVLISFVLGALTGVGMWFTTIQISPRTIGLMVTEFHWLWAIEWTFFCVEIVSGYLFYRYGKYLSDGARMRLLIMYTAAAWASLFWINGILSWQLTPGHWPQTHSVWDGFFNPSFWPSLVFRTVTSMTIAGIVGCLVINTMRRLRRGERLSLITRASHFLGPMVLMPALGYWYLQTMPADSRSWVLGGSVAMTLFLNLAIAASLLIGVYALVALLWKKLYINAASAALLLALALGATAGGEFVREGVRKPYTVRQVLYSNSITETEVARLRVIGCVTNDPYPVLNKDRYPNDQVRVGMKVFRFQCSVCHTLHGTNGLMHLVGTWSTEQKRLNIAMLQLTKPFMPPFAGTADELEALVQWLEWNKADRPAGWKVFDNPAARRQVQQYLSDAGTEPGIE